MSQILLQKLREYIRYTAPDVYKLEWDEEEVLKVSSSMGEEFFNALPAATPWKRYITGDRKTYPPKYGRYLVNRKGGQFRIEVWNNTGFSRDDSNIEFWAEVIPPYIN